MARLTKAQTAKPTTIYCTVGLRDRMVAVAEAAGLKNVQWLEKIVAAAEDKAKKARARRREARASE